MRAAVVLSNLFGTLGLIFWSLQLTPQVWQNYKHKSTRGFNVWMGVVWFIGGAVFLVYLLASNSPWPLVIQMFLFTSISCFIIFQYFLYDSKRYKERAILYGLVLYCGMLVLDVGIFFVIRVLHDNFSWIGAFFAIFSSVATGGGFLPEIKDIIAEQYVNLSFVFVGMDILGAIFSSIAMAFDASDRGESIDWYGASIYFTVGILQCVIAGLAIFFNKILGHRAPIHPHAKPGTTTTTAAGTTTSTSDTPPLLEDQPRLSTSSDDSSHSTHLLKESTSDSDPSGTSNNPFAEDPSSHQAKKDSIEGGMEVVPLMEIRSSNE